MERPPIDDWKDNLDKVEVVTLIRRAELLIRYIEYLEDNGPTLITSERVMEVINEQPTGP